MCWSIMAASRLWKLKGGSRERREQRGNDQVGKVFCHLWTLLCGGFGGRRKVALLRAHAARLGPLRSKLKSGWKITTLHDRSTSLFHITFHIPDQTWILFHFKTWASQCHLPSATTGLNKGLIKTLTQGKGLPQTMGSIQELRHHVWGMQVIKCQYEINLHISFHNSMTWEDHKLLSHWICVDVQNKYGDIVTCRWRCDELWAPIHYEQLNSLQNLLEKVIHVKEKRLHWE